MLLLPLVPSIPEYRVAIALEGVSYLFDLKWNASNPEGWFMDILLSDETRIASGVKIVLGAFLGRRATHESRPRGIIVASDLSNTDVEAGFDDLGRRVLVYYYERAEMAEIVAAG